MSNFRITINGNVYDVAVRETGADTADVEISGKSFSVSVEKGEAYAAAPAAPARKVRSPYPGKVVSLSARVGQTVSRGQELAIVDTEGIQNTVPSELNGVITEVSVKEGDEIMPGDIIVSVGSAAPAAAPRPVQRAAGAPRVTTAKKVVKSPLPGNVIKVYVTQGQAVKRGDTLLTIESMKMENSVLAEANGVVTAVYVTAGQNVMPGDALVDFGAEVVEPAPAQAQQAAPAQQAPAPAPAPKPAGGLKSVKSPLPGTVVKVQRKKGDAVKRGDTIIVVESMKMENSIMADRDGVLAEVYVKEQQSIMQGDPLFDIK